VSHLLIALGVFLATHIVLAENPVRGALVRAMGERPFIWAYGAIAALQLVWIGQAVDAAPVVRYWQPPAWTIIVPLLVMPLALLLLVCGFTQGNPTASLASRRNAAPLPRPPPRPGATTTRAQGPTSPDGARPTCRSSR
jgi:uncharacterized membrane protein